MWNGSPGELDGVVTQLAYALEQALRFWQSTHDSPQFSAHCTALLQCTVPPPPAPEKPNPLGAKLVKLQKALTAVLGSIEQNVAKGAAPQKIAGSRARAEALKVEIEQLARTAAETTAVGAPAEDLSPSLCEPTSEAVLRRVCSLGYLRGVSSSPLYREVCGGSNNSP